MKKKRSSNLGRSTKWTSISTVVNVVVLMLQLSILSRQFESETFGQFAVINIFVEIFTTFAMGGIANYLIYRKDLDQRGCNAVFVLALVFGIFSFIIFNFLAAPLTAIFGYPELMVPMKIVSILLIISAVSGQYQAIALKDFKHSTLSKIEIFARFSAFGIAMYTISWGLYCLVASTVGYAFLRLVGCILFFSKQAKFSFNIDRKVLSSALSYGAYSVGGQTINIIRKQADTLILTAILPLSQLGVYHLIKQLASKPASALQPIINRTALPAFGHVRYDGDRLKQVYMDIFFVQSLVLGFIYAPMISASELIITLVFGSGYAEYHLIFALLSGYWMIRICGGTLIGPLTQSSGKTKHSFIWNCCVFPINIIVVYMTASINILWLAGGLLSMQLPIIVLANIFLIRRIISVPSAKVLMFMLGSLLWFIVPIKTVLILVDQISVDFIDQFSIYIPSQLPFSIDQIWGFCLISLVMMIMFFITKKYLAPLNCALLRLKEV